MEKQNSSGDANNKLKMAIAMALFKSKLLQNQKPPSDSVPKEDSRPENSQLDDALKWKRKAKERKREILRLQEDLKIAEDGGKYDVFPQNASCKCYFFDDVMEFSKNNQFDDDSSSRFKDVLRRRFFRQGISERKRRRNGSSMQQHIPGSNFENEIEQLSASVDFLVDLCETVSPVNMEEKMHKSWSHQAVDFILSTLKSLLEEGSYIEAVEGIVSSLVIRLLRRMCNSSYADDLGDLDTNVQIYIQHLLRKLGSEPYIGQRLILSVSQNISTAAESLLFMDPFNDTFPSLHNCMYILIQIIEFLISDYFLNWSTRADFDLGFFEEWVASVLQAKKALELLENRNGLYVIYIDRVIGDIAKQVSQSSCFQRLNPNLRSMLFISLFNIDH